MASHIYPGPYTSSPYDERCAELTQRALDLSKEDGWVYYDTKQDIKLFSKTTPGMFTLFFMLLHTQ
jgi:hypothetical protein